jgi:hypothetical protein
LGRDEQNVFSLAVGNQIISDEEKDEIIEYQINPSGFIFMLSRDFYTIEKIRACNPPPTAELLAQITPEVLDTINHVTPAIIRAEAELFLTILKRKPIMYTLKGKVLFDGSYPVISFIDKTRFAVAYPGQVVATDEIENSVRSQFYELFRVLSQQHLKPYAVSGIGTAVNIYDPEAHSRKCLTTNSELMAVLGLDESDYPKMCCELTSQLMDVPTYLTTTKVHVDYSKLAINLNHENKFINPFDRQPLADTDYLIDRQLQK